MWSGIWPPSKPLMDTPERLFWPFWPRPPVLPLPEPMPRPTRIRLLRAPALSRMSLSFISLHSLSLCSRHPAVPSSSGRRQSVDHRNHVRQLGDRAADLRSVLELDHTMHFSQAETGKDLL